MYIVCADISLFSSYQAGDSGALLMGNSSHACVFGVGMVILKFNSGRTVLMKNMQHVSSIKKNLGSGFQLCRDGYKIVFEANKVILYKFGTFTGKSYNCGGLFRLSILDVCNNVVNHTIILDETNIWHSRFCYVNFGYLTQLANLNFILKFNLVKGSKCHVCV